MERGWGCFVRFDVILKEHCSDLTWRGFLEKVFIFRLDVEEDYN